MGWRSTGCSIITVILLQACSSSSEEEPPSPFSSVTPDTEVDTEVDTELTGSVGDGPIINADITVVSKTGEVLSAATSSQNAGYNIQLKVKGKHYPLTIEARGGTDLATLSAPDLTLTSAATEPRKKSVVNLNPYATVAIETARRMNGGLSTNNIDLALGYAVRSFNLGLTSALSIDPMTTVIDDDNLAEIVKASEAMAEIFRRTSRELSSTTGTSIDGTIAAIAADLVDGQIDGRGASGTNPRISGTLIIVSAQVVLETMRNELTVNGQLITPTLDSIVAQLATGPSPPLTNSRPVTANMIAQALEGIDRAIALANTPELTELRAAVETLAPGSSATEAAAALPAGSTTTLDASLQILSTGGTSEIDTALGYGGGSIPPPNTAPSISGVLPSTATVGAMYRFTPVASDVDGDLLTFSISGQPGWLNFDPATGTLTGTPTSFDVGTHSGIGIAVSDGQSSDTIGPFSISVAAPTTQAVTLSWLPPTVNTDGTPLTDLAGYRVYWGRDSGNYTDSATIDNAGVTTYVIEDLNSGMLYLAVSAFNDAAIESTLSNEASIAIQ